MRIVHELYLDADLPICELLTALHKLPLNSVYKFASTGVSGAKLTFYSESEVPKAPTGPVYRGQDDKRWDLS